MAVVVVTGWAGATGAAQAAEPLPVADFFRRPAFVSMVMAPNGQSIAATAAGADGRVGLVILTLRDLSQSKSVAEFSDVDIRTVQWVNDDRLVFDVTDRRLPYGEQKGTGLFAVDREGKEAVRMLVQREWRFFTRATSISDRTLPLNHALHSVLRDAKRVCIAGASYGGYATLVGLIRYPELGLPDKARGTL